MVVVVLKAERIVATKKRLRMRLTRTIREIGEIREIKRGRNLTEAHLVAHQVHPRTEMETVKKDLVMVRLIGNVSVIVGAQTPRSPDIVEVCHPRPQHFRVTELRRTHACS